ncbi:MAG: hypothetical protein ACOH2D_05870 [Gelidibacter sp.]|uniref:hypothetical protein n=1 Tax=Gelidibacter sp. TaxID=2018083 RepID=UPI00326541E0
MKNQIAILFIATLFISCKNDSKSEVSLDDSRDGLSVREISGNFTYFADAAVFQTKNELFGVVENEKAQELITMAEPLKDAPTDEVRVTLKVMVVKKPEHEEGWENRIDIIDIINVLKVNPKDSEIIKIITENKNH